MKKIDIIKKVTEINVEVVNLLEKSDYDIENEFKSFIEKFYSDFGHDSFNFTSVLSYYHGGRRDIESFISGLNYYMNTIDGRDITYCDVMEDLKVMKKLYKHIKEFLNNYNDEAEIKNVCVCDEGFVPYYGIKNKEKFNKLPEYKQLYTSEKMKILKLSRI